MIRKQQGHEQSLQGRCSTAKGTRCPRTRPSLFQNSQKQHIRCAKARSLDLETTLMLVEHDALGAPDHVRGGQGARSACPLSGLVVIAAAKLPIPSRTRPISATTPMVLRLKTWESRSPPNLTSDRNLSQTISRQSVARHQAQNQPEKPVAAGSSKRPNAKGNCPQQWPNPKARAAPADQRSKSVAGWSSPVARQAHNLKVTGSNPVPATIVTCLMPAAPLRALACPPPPPQSVRIAPNSP